MIYKEIPIDQEGKWEGEIDEFAKERGYKNVGIYSVTYSFVWMGDGEERERGSRVLS